MADRSITMSERVDIYVKDEKILKHLKKQQNRSAYICNLVEKDMNNNQFLTRQEVIQLIQEYTSGNNPIQIKKSVSQLFD